MDHTVLVKAKASVAVDIDPLGTVGSVRYMANVTGLSSQEGKLVSVTFPTTITLEGVPWYIIVYVLAPSLSPLKRIIKQAMANAMKVDESSIDVLYTGVSYNNQRKLLVKLQTTIVASSHDIAVSTWKQLTSACSLSTFETVLKRKLGTNWLFQYMFVSSLEHFYFSENKQLEKDQVLQNVYYTNQEVTWTTASNWIKDGTLELQSQHWVINGFTWSTAASFHYVYSTYSLVVINSPQTTNGYYLDRLNPFHSKQLYLTIDGSYSIDSDINW